MSIIHYIEGDEKLLDLIRPMWEALNEHHRLNSVFFQDRYAGLKFQERSHVLTEKAREGKLRVDMARDSAAGQLVGYCVSSINRQIGEIDSLYVRPEYRQLGIGGQLMLRALEWMDKNMVTSKTVGVAAGNDQAFEFYARYGFYPSMTILRQKSNI